LTPDQEYTLSTDLTDEHHIDPKEAEFVDYDSYTNYTPTFQLRLKTVVEEVNLLLKEHDGPENERVWNRLVSLPASPTEVKSTGNWLTRSGKKRRLEAEISRLEEKLRFMKRMLAVPALLLTTLEEMNPQELKTFQCSLTSGLLPDCPPIPESQLENANRQVTVDQMVKTYGPERAVEITLRILSRMNREDLAEKLERDHRGATLRIRRPTPNIHHLHSHYFTGSSKELLALTSAALLLTTLEELTEEQLKTFMWFLTSGLLPDCPPIPERQLQNADRQVTVDEMVESFRPERAVEITVEILRRMNLDYLIEKLKRDHTRAWLLTTLEQLNTNELKTFKNYLTSGQLLGFPPIPESQLENADRQVTVGQMEKRYGPERAVKVTLRILSWMNEHDLTEKLQRDHTGKTAIPIHLFFKR
ncbi:unnamed protein product, partial [Coregonus sp. 'balchen']